MEFTRLLSAVVVFCSTIGCINAAESVLKIDFSNDGSNGVKYDASYSYGMKKCSDGSNNMEELASSINSLSKGALSVGSTDREYIDSDMGSYTIGTNDGGTRNLVVLDDVKCGSGLDKLFFNGDVKNPTSVQMNFNRASDMKLPLVKCNDMALLKFKINNTSCSDVGFVKGLEVDAPTGLFYNVPIKINGGKYNNAKSNLNDVCSVADKGLNNIKFANGKKYKFGCRYCIPGISDKLEAKGLRMINITFTQNKPVGAKKVVRNMDIDFINIAEDGLIAVDTNVNRNQLRRPNDKISTPYCVSSYVFKSHRDLKEQILQNDFMNFEIV